MRRATLVTAAVVGVCGAAAAQTYSVTDLGTAGGLVGAGFAVNALGHAVGVGTRDDAQRSGHSFGYSQVLLQIAIVLGSVAILSL